MSKLCINCLDTFKDDAIVSAYKQNAQGIYQECPRRACDGRVYQIDDTILPTIQMLNSKGYKTYSSCGGHMFEENPEAYIEFDESVRSLPELPYGFELRYNLLPGNKKRIVMYKKIQTEDFYDVFSGVLDTANELYNWSLEIDIAEEVFGTTIMIIDPELMSMFGYSEEHKPAEKKKEKSKLDKDKIKKISDSGTIKLKTAENTDNTSEDIEEQAPEQGLEEAKPKTGKKRGRPKKEDK